MVKFYKDLDGNWHLGDKIIPAGTCWIDYDESNDIKIVSLYDSKDIKFEGAFTSLVKEDGTNYASIAAMLSTNSDFFVEADVAAITNHEALDGLLGGATSDHQHLTLSEVELLDYIKTLDTNAILYFNIDSTTAPQLNDFRLRKDSLYLYIEKYNGTSWLIVSTIGGSIETDSFKMKGELCSILNIQNDTPFNVWRITSNINGNEFGSSRRDLYLTGSGSDKFYISYNKPTLYSYNIETTNTTLLSSNSYQKEITADKNYELQTMILNVATTTKLRIIVTDKLENRVIYKSVSDSEFATNGGISIKDYITNNTTGIIEIQLVGVFYLVKNRSYYITFELSTGSLNGSNVFPYCIAKGYEFVSDVIASRPWVEEQKYVRTVATQIGDKTVTNTLTETSILDGVIGVPTLPANFLTVGKTIRIKVVGIYSGLNTETPTVKIKLGNYVLVTSTQALPKTFTNVQFDTEFVFTCRSIGTNGTVIGQGNVTIFDGVAITTSTTRALLMMSPVTIDTTIPLLIDVTYKWSTANTGNSIRTTNVTIESFN